MLFPCTQGGEGLSRQRDHQMERMGRSLCGHRKQSLRKEKRCSGAVCFFFWTSPVPHWPSPPMVHLGCQVQAWFQAESCLMFTRACNGPAAHPGPQATGWEVGVNGDLLCCTFGQNVSCCTVLWQDYPTTWASLILIG